MQIDITTARNDHVDVVPELRGFSTADGKHLIVVTDGLGMFMTPAEMSEFGHRFIELAAIAEEREHGPVDLDRVVA